MTARRAGRASLFFVLTVWCVVPVGAQQSDLRDSESFPRPAARATSTGDRIRMDGRLGEAAWRAPTPIPDFIQSQPRHPEWRGRSNGR